MSNTDPSPPNPKPGPMRFGARLRSLRLNACLSVVQVGERIGVTGVRVAAIERGDRPPTEHRIRQLAFVYEANAELLLAHWRSEVLAEELRALAIGLANLGHDEAAELALAAVDKIAPPRGLPRAAPESRPKTSRRLRQKHAEELNLPPPSAW